MGLNWSNIYNGEIASSVRTKLNNLGNYADNMVQIVSNVTIPQSSWVSDTTYSAYPYKATVSIAGVDGSSDIVNVLFSQTDQNSYRYAGGEVENGTISIYSVTQPTADITIPNILIFKGVI